MSAAEFLFWEQWGAARGFPAERAEVVAANGAAYVGATWGGKAKPADLVWRERRPASRAAVRAFFDSLTPDKFPSVNE
ncbi:MAG TPA: hypothetical protein VD866_03180 [Urbifossiella sp.]|nr:hypothetical protein [Urbifossiella sp.]